jgi:LacI family transcriptional regulator
MFFNVVRGAQREAFQRGYTLVLADSQESDLREAEAAERVAPFVDGLILVTTRLNDDQIRKLAEWKPLVVINRKVDGVDGVLPDITPGVDEALVHLSGLGHQTLAFLSGPANSWMSRARRETLFRNAPEHGMAIVEIGPGVPTLEGGREVLTQVLASGATAVLAYNDLMAIGLMRAAQQRGLVVPDRLSIIGFDDIFGSDFTSPPLSTIRTPLDRIGERAVWRALELVEGREGSPPPERHELALATELVVRGSTGLASRVFI